MDDHPAPEPAPERIPLSTERIETAALALIEREGLAGFSIRKLAGSLGCTAMGLYHYFPSKGHLMDALIDRVIGEMPAPPGDLPWKVRLRALAIGWRRQVLSRPALALYVATHRMNTPRSLAWLESVLALIREGCASDAEAARMLRAIGYYLMGAVLDETAGYSRGPSTVTPVPDEVMARDYPNVVAAAPHFVPAAREATFLAGLDALIDGWVAARPNRGQAPEPSAPTPSSEGSNS
jgi:AcrR family transcriptional regulator